MTWNRSTSTRCSRRPSDEHAHARSGVALDAAKEDGARMVEAVRTWAPAETKKVEKKGPILHAEREAKGAIRWTECGRRTTALFGGRITAHTTSERSAVTCPKCLARLSGAA